MVVNFPLSKCFVAKKIWLRHTRPVAAVVAKQGSKHAERIPPLQSHYTSCAFVQHYHVEMKALIGNFENKRDWIEGERVEM